MATKANRGTKRTCQNEDCGARFYDLNRDPITCPICSSVYALASAPAAVVASAVGEDKAGARSKAKKPEFVPVVEDGVPVEVPAAESEDALPEVEGEETIAAEEDETFLEEDEEEGGDVTGIIGGTVAEDEEEP